MSLETYQAFLFFSLKSLQKHFFCSYCINNTRIQINKMNQFQWLDLEITNNLGAAQSSATFGITHLIGVVLMMITAGLSSLAGLGGGGPNVVVMIIFFDMLPKNATLIIFACVFGSSFGNVVHQMQKAYNGQPIVNYNFAFVIIPIMFMGALIGVFLNKLLPSFVIMLIIVSVATNSLTKIYKRFVEGHKKQTQQMLILSQNEGGRISQLIQQTAVNPFQSQLNIRIFKQIILMIFCYSCISLMKGSQKFPSILGITSCSIMYWLFQLVLFLQGWLFFKSNKNLLQIWHAPTITLGQELFEQKQDCINQNIKQVFTSCIFAGVFNGFGLGGGLFLMPALRKLNLSPIQATSTAALIVCITSFINVLQAIFLGVLSIPMFLTFFSITALGSLTISMVLSKYLRRINRMSYIQLLLFFLLALSNVYYPYSLWLKYNRAGNDLAVIFGFGSFC